MSAPPAGAAAPGAAPPPRSASPGAASPTAASPPGRLARLDAAVLRVADGKAIATRTPFVWGLVEATFFVIVPDVAIAYAALYGWRRGLVAVGWAIAGAVVGGLLVLAAPGFWDGVIPRLPGVSQALIDDAAARFAGDGWWAVVTAPSAGHPYKVYALLAAQEGRPWWQLLLVTPVARGWRFLGAAGVAALIGLALRRPLRARPSAMLGLFLAFWTLLYVRYFLFLAARY